MIDRRAPAITCAAIQANLDHAIILTIGSAANTAEVDQAIDGACIERISRVSFQRGPVNPEADLAMFVGWDGVEEFLVPVMNIYQFGLFAHV